VTVVTCCDPTEAALVIGWEQSSVEGVARQTRVTKIDLLEPYSGAVMKHSPHVGLQGVTQGARTVPFMARCDGTVRWHGAMALAKVY
jgi:hypothetical protein